MGEDSLPDLWMMASPGLPMVHLQGERVHAQEVSGVSSKDNMDTIESALCP